MLEPAIAREGNNVARSFLLLSRSRGSLRKLRLQPFEFHRAQLAVAGRHLNLQCLTCSRGLQVLNTRNAVTAMLSVFVLLLDCSLCPYPRADRNLCLVKYVLGSSSA